MSHTKGFLPLFSSLSSAILGIISCITCPLCLPLYTAMLGFLGLDIEKGRHYILPVALFFFGVTLCSLGLQIYKTHNNYLPLFIIIASYGVIYVGYSFSKIPFIILGACGLFYGIILNKKLIKGGGGTKSHKCC